MSDGTLTFYNYRLCSRFS